MDVLKPVFINVGIKDTFWLIVTWMYWNQPQFCEKYHIPLINSNMDVLKPISFHIFLDFKLINSNMDVLKLAFIYFLPFFRKINSNMDVLKHLLEVCAGRKCD